MTNITVISSPIIKITGTTIRTPWGKAQKKQVIADGIVKYHTTSHGGYKLDRKHNSLVPAPIRQDGGWYEEDGNHNFLVITFPQYFTNNDIRSAIEHMSNNYCNTAALTYKAEQVLDHRIAYDIDVEYVYEPVKPVKTVTEHAHA